MYWRYTQIFICIYEILFIVGFAIKSQQLNSHLHQLLVKFVLPVTHLVSPSASVVLTTVRHYNIVKVESAHTSV